MMRNLVLPALLVVIVSLWATTQSAYAEIEKGYDYDREMLGTVQTVDGSKLLVRDTIFQTPRITDNGKFVDYTLTEDDGHVYYHSAKFFYVFDKPSCAFGIYDGIQKSFSLLHIMKEAEDMTDDWNVSADNFEQCKYEVSQSGGIVTITATRGGFHTIYDISHVTGFEWTYKYTNWNPLNTKKYGVTALCDGPKCDDIKIDGQIMKNSTVMASDLEDKTITVGAQLFDTKNDEHGYLWALKKQNDKMIVDFTFAKKALGFGETMVIDPTFGPASSSYVKTVETNVLADTICDAVNTNDTSDVVKLPGSAVASRCKVTGLEFNVSSLPQVLFVTSTVLTVDVGVPVSTTLNCDVVKVTDRITTANASRVYSAITGGTPYLDGNSFCTTAGAGKTLTLGTTANSDLSTVRSSNQGWISYGIRTDTMTRPAGSSEYGFSNWKLTVTYLTDPPNPVTGLSCSGVAQTIQCSWTASSPITGASFNGITAHYIGRSLDNSTWTNKTSVANVTSATIQSISFNHLYYINVTAARGLTNATAAYTSVTTDTYPTAPLNPYGTALGDSVIKVNWQTPSSNGNDPITGYRVEYCITCTSWLQLVNNTNTLNYNQTGIPGGSTVKYHIAAWNGVGLSPYTSNVTVSTFSPTTGTVTLGTGVIGDTVQVNATVSITAGSPSPVTITQSKLYSNGTLVETRAESESVSVPGSVTLDPLWYRMLTGDVYQLKVVVTATNATGTVTLNATSNETREYDPVYVAALDDPAVEGNVNYTVSRFDAEDGILLHVNRVGGTLGSTWTINCITQTNAEAQATRNQSQTWPGTWNNRSGTGYFNGTWSGFRNTQGYVSCFNPPGLLFTTTTYTNSSLALFGIAIFDASYGSMLGVPVGIFFLALAGGMANKRTAPTWIVVLLGMAGVMATIGFFTISPIIWGVALITGLLGLLVNSKVF